MWSDVRFHEEFYLHQLALIAGLSKVRFAFNVILVSSSKAQALTEGVATTPILVFYNSSSPTCMP